MQEFLEVLRYVPRGDFAVFAGLIGLFLGSFYNVCADRTLAGVSIVWPPSHCESCGARLTALDLVPVLSWAILRGRCRHCGAAVSWRYPAAEVASGLLAASAGWVFGPTVAWLAAMAIAALLLILSLIDLRAQILPDGLNLALAVIALPASILVFGNGWENVLLGGLLGAGVFWAVGVLYMKRRGIEGLGMGDVKLMVGAGFLVTAELLPLAVIIASVTALAAFGIAALAGRGGSGIAQLRLPFGPFLALAAWIVLLAGDDLWRLWLDIIL